jgi:hypothetical protein
MQFHVPHWPLLVSNQFVSADPTLVAIGNASADGFDRHLVHQGRLGTTTLTNTVQIAGLGSATGAGAVVVTDSSPLPGGIVITEMVLDPKQDWNDTSGGNGVPFDATPGTGAVDVNDIWIEISTPTTGTENWTIRLTDVAGGTSSKVLGPVSIAGPPVRVLSGFGSVVMPIVKVELVDQSGVVRQTLDIAAMQGVLGPATGAADESLTWSIYGSPTPLLQQFLRRVATIGVFNPF